MWLYTQRIRHTNKSNVDSYNHNSLVSKKKKKKSPKVWF
jgi:hypothetical protein